MKTVLLICNTSGSVVLFRKALIGALNAAGHKVCVAAFDSEHKTEIEAMNVTFYSVDDDNRSTNPLKVLSLEKKYYKIIKAVAPDIVFTFMMKPNIFGVRAAKKAGVEKIFSMVEGAGDVFANDGLKWKLIRSVVCKMYRKSFKYPDKVFFLNHDDKAEFVSRKLVREDKCEIIPGIGIDTAHFAHKPVNNYKTFLMIARMLKTKGVMEYCEAARKVKKIRPDAVFNYLGGEGTIKVSDIREYIDDGSVNYLGTAADVRPYLEDCAVYVLPSYREGMSVSVMEAESVGRAVIASDVPGCREAVADGENGYLTERGNSDALAEKMLSLLSDTGKIERMGEKSRALATEKFAVGSVTAKLLSAIGI